MLGYLFGMLVLQDSTLSKTYKMDPKSALAFITEIRSVLDKKRSTESVVYDEFGCAMLSIHRDDAVFTVPVTLEFVKSLSIAEQNIKGDCVQC